MKSNETVGKTETFEDIVFEGRNKSYGAYDLNKKRRKYLVVSFLITFVGFTTTVAVPFLGTLKEPGTKTITFETPPVIIKGVKPDKPQIVLPPPPPVISKKMQDIVSYKVPDVVEEVSNSGVEFNIDLVAQGTNLMPVDVDIDYYPSDGRIFEEPEKEEIVLFPSEPATFSGCEDLTCFHKWVMENINYPEEAASQNVFGRVVLEFCVNSKGKVVDINIMRSIHPSLDKEVIRVISSSPLWTPAKQGGTPVKQRFVIPCSFEMN